MVCLQRVTLEMVLVLNVKEGNFVMKTKAVEPEKVKCVLLEVDW